MLVRELERALDIIQADHTNPQLKSCRHCILRFKKSKLITNIFVGDLSTVSEEFRNTLFCELVMTKNLYCHERDINTSSGLTISMQKTIKRMKNHSGELKINLPFLCFTRDEGYFKDNITVHAVKAVISQEDSESPNLQSPESSLPKKDPAGKAYFAFTSDTFYKPAKIDILFKHEIDQNLYSIIDESFWKYFRSQEKTHFEAKDPSLSIDKTIQESMSEKGSKQSRQSNQIFSNEKVYLVMMYKRNRHKDFLREFETEPMNKDYKLDKILFSIGEISSMFHKREDFTSLLNVKKIY